MKWSKNDLRINKETGFTPQVQRVCITCFSKSHYYWDCPEEEEGVVERAIQELNSDKKP